MNYNYLCVFDFETSSRYRDVAQILSIGAAIIDNRTLEVKDTFKSLVKPEDWNTVEDEALRVNKLTREELEASPDVKTVWPTWVSWVNKYNKGKKGPSPFDAPIPCGYNIIGYDLPIVRRYAERLGPWDDKRKDQKIFSQVYKFDLMDHIWYWTETDPEIPNLTLAGIAEWMGFSEQELATAHDALGDVMMCCKIIQRLFKLQRYFRSPDENGHRRLELKGAFKNAQVN